MRVMMSAAGSAVAPSIIRHLQSLGHYVIGHDCCEYGYGASLCDEFRVSNPIKADPFGYIETVDRSQPDIYLPFLDEELGLATLEKWSSPSKTNEIFTNKHEQQYWLEYAALPVAPRDWSGEWIAKPSFGRGGRGQVRGTGHKHSGEVLAHALHVSGFVVQRYITGDEYTIDVLTDREGAFLFAVSRLRIQANGVSVIGKIVMDQEIIDLARQVVSKFKFSGPINIQVIRERDTGKLYIIEVNPRLSGSCMFTVMAGFDILDATIKLWDGKPFVPPSKIDDGLIIRRHYVEERL